MSVTEGIVGPFSVGLAYQDWLDVATPAAGAQASFTVPGDYSMRVIAARAQITTDANAANRIVTLDFANARSSVYHSNGAGKLITANTTAQAIWWSRNRSVSETVAGAPIWCPLLDEIMPPGFTITWAVAAIQATDQLSQLRLWVEKFPTGSRGYPMPTLGADISYDP
jgi:hypothetical protein